MQGAVKIDALVRIVERVSKEVIMIKRSGINRRQYDRRQRNIPVEIERRFLTDRHSGIERRKLV